MTDPQGQGCGVEKIMEGLLWDFAVSRMRVTHRVVWAAPKAVGRYAVGVQLLGLFKHIRCPDSGFRLRLESHLPTQECALVNSQKSPPQSVERLRKQVWVAFPGLCGCRTVPSPRS